MRKGKNKDKAQVERVHGYVSEKGGEPRIRGTKLSQLGILFVAVIMISGSLGYLIGADAPASAPNTWIDDEELSVYKVNGIRYAVDGTTDGIQDAIDDLPSAGGLVVVPNGEYTWTEPFVPTASNWALAGSPSTTIIVSGDTNGLNLVSIENVTISHLRFDGEKSGKVISSNCIFVSGSTDITLRDVRVEDWFGNALWVQVCENVIIEDSIVKDSDKSVNRGAITAWNAVNVTIRGNVVEDAIVANGNGGECSNVKIIGNTLTGHPLSHGGIYAYRGAHHVLIDSNYATGFQHGGVEARAENVTITNNILSGNEWGIQVEAVIDGDVCRNILISQNIITGNTYEGIGIFQSGSYMIPKYISIENNLIASNGRFGIYSETPCEYISISSNVFRQNGNWAMYTTSHNTTIDGNEFYQSIGTEVIRIGGDNCTVRGNLIVNSSTSAAYGIRLADTARDTLVEGNFINDLYGSSRGIFVGISKRFAVLDNWVERMFYGIDVSTSQFGVISGNTVTDCRASGIYLSASSSIAITGNAAYRNYAQGIYLTGSSFCTITGNMANDNERDPIGQAGIRLTDSHNITVTSNIAMDTSTPSIMTYGLYISGTNDYIYVAFNIFSPVLGVNYTGSTGANNYFFANV